MTTWSDPFAPDGVPCRRCVVAPMPGQLRLFERDAEGAEVGRAYDGAATVGNERGGWPPIETSHCGRVGFWRERTPFIFGNRTGIGPLVVMPDTNILIGIRDQLEEVEGALVVHPLWSDRKEPVDALRDLVQLWWWRDLRLAASPMHLSDSRKPLTEARRRAREDAVRELARDFFERGELEAVVSDDLCVEDRPCPLHAIPPMNVGCSSSLPQDRAWPRDELDRRLVRAAYDAGCHVFLTTDKDVLKSHASLFRHGLAILSPAELLEALDESGELDSTRGGDFLLPDLSTLSRLYAGFADC